MAILTGEIYNRLIQYSLCVDYNETLTECIETARARKDEYGEQVLNQLKDEYKEKQKGVLALIKKCCKEERLPSHRVQKKKILL